MFEARLRPIKPWKVTLSHEQYANVMEEAEFMQPVMQRFIARIAGHVRGCACEWEFSIADTASVGYEITEVSHECPWHVDRLKA